MGIFIKLLGRNFNYDMEYIDEVATQNNFTEEQKARFLYICRDLSTLTYEDAGYKKLSKDQIQQYLTEVINGINQFPEYDPREQIYLKDPKGYNYGLRTECSDEKVLQREINIIRHSVSCSSSEKDDMIN